MSKQSDLINGTFTDSIDVTGTVVADGLTVDGSGGQVTTDNNGFIISKQLLDVGTAGGRFIGKSNRGELGHIAIEQTATSADGGYIRFATSPAGSTTPADRMRIDSAGRVTMPYQPSFHVTSNSSVPLTGSLNFNVNIHNVGNHFSGGVFTAPIAGLYQFNFYGFSGANGANATPSGSYSVATLVKNGNSVMSTYAQFFSTAYYAPMGFSGAILLSANDSVGIDITGYVYSDSANPKYLGFSGYLVG
jgi:hypothetical protein